MKASMDIHAISPLQSSSEDVIAGYLPEKNSFGRYGDFELVGHGGQTGDSCGKFGGFRACSRVDLHNLITLDGVNHQGQVFFKAVHYSCDKPSCPICYRSGWAVRQGQSITDRLKEGSKHFGPVEHIVPSVPVRDYGLSYEVMRRKVTQVLKKRGVIGGAMIFHAFRYDLNKHWYFSPHFHVLGYIKGGYSKCRNCRRKWNCLRGCGGFDDKNYHDGFLKDGYIVKVLGKRKSIYHTAWYQLHHSSVDVTKKRFHVATWFGVVSYRKMKFTPERRKALCPICKHELVEHWYCGNNPDILAVFGSDRRSCKTRWGYADYREDGRVVWVERVG